VRPEGLGKLNKKITSSGIEPTTLIYMKLRKDMSYFGAFQVLSKLARIHAADIHSLRDLDFWLYFQFLVAYGAKQCSEVRRRSHRQPATLTCTVVSDLTQTASLVAMFKLLGIVVM
jgi:hypothetical protein